MNKFISSLAGLFVLQVFVAAGLYFSGQDKDFDQLNKPLLSFNVDEIDKVVISDNTFSSELSRNNDGWYMPNYHSLPVDQERLDALMTNLKDFKSSWPVATTSSAQERFEVSEEKFQKRIQLYSGEDLVTEMFIGDSPSYRNAYIRVSNQDEIYAAKIAQHEIYHRTFDWMNKKLLHVDNIESIKGKDFELQKTDDDWGFATSPSSLEEGVTLNKESATSLAEAISRMHVNAVADSLPEVTYTLNVTNPDGNLQFSLASEGEKYFVKRSDIDTAFTIGKSDFEKITQTGFEQLAQIVTPEPANETTSEDQNLELEQVPENAGELPNSQLEPELSNNE